MLQRKQNWRQNQTGQTNFQLCFSTEEQYKERLKKMLVAWLHREKGTRVHLAPHGEEGACT